MRAWLFAASIALGACSDGYPTEDLQVVEPSRMTQRELLQSLNALDGRWRYALAPGCALRVQVRHAEPPDRLVVLRGMALEQRTHDGIIEVLARPAEGPAAVVLETPRWSDAVWVRSLLTHLEASC